jgi:hypothetical protein
MTIIETLVINYAIATVSIALFFGIAFVISSTIEAITAPIKRNRAIAYRLANQCKGITLKGVQCLKEKDCPNHKQANA